MPLPRLDRPIILTTNASDFALGEILFKEEIGFDLPISYASKPSISITSKNRLWRKLPLLKKKKAFRILHQTKILSSIKKKMIKINVKNYTTIFRT